MYCGGKRYSPSSSEASIINRVFHVSWFPNKSKPKSSHPHRTKSSQTQPRSQPARPSPNSHSPPFQKEPRFYSLDDDDAYWRLSFREQKTEDRKSITGITHLSSDSDHDKFQIPVSGITSSGFGNSSNSMHQNVSLRNSSLSSSPEEDYAFGRRVRYDGTESRRKSPRRKIKQKKRGNNYSPKGEFRVRVLEDMKEKTMRSEKKEMIKVGPVGGTTIYDSFAEVKSSFDPQQDFRDSMVEMICEKGIRRAEELEDLLACYLNLNCDEHHHLIIKVFQQVLLELSQQRCGALILKRKS